MSTEDTRFGSPRVEGTRITVLDIYRAYARQGEGAAKVVDEFDINLADVHEAFAYYYRHAEEMCEEERALDEAHEQARRETTGLDE